MNLTADLFLTFAKIGMFTFGGGYAMIPIIEDHCVVRKQWITATYVGYKQKGIAGTAAATIGMAVPSLVIIFLISLFLDRFLEIRWVASAFRGIKLAVGILILDAAVRMIRKMPKKPFPVTVTACAFTAMLLINIFAVRVTSIMLMLVAGLIGLVVFLAGKRKEGAAK